MEDGKFIKEVKSGEFLDSKATPTLQQPRKFIRGSISIIWHSHHQKFEHYWIFDFILEVFDFILEVKSDSNRCFKCRLLVCRMDVATSLIILLISNNCHSPTQPQLELELNLIMGRNPPPPHPTTQELLRHFQTT